MIFVFANVSGMVKLREKVFLAVTVIIIIYLNILSEKLSFSFT